MYGIINKAIQAMICEQYNEDTWASILQDANCDTEVFVGIEQYPDDTTYQLVGSASKILSISSDKLLEDIGKYWITYTGNGDYQHIFKVVGDNYFDFLKNLNHMHSRVGTIMAKLQPPQFDCKNLSDTTLQLHYYSHRPGFKPMIVGLLQGLADWFKVEVKIEHQKSEKLDGQYHEQFRLELIQ